MNKKALSLMEIIVSVTILTVVMAGLLNFFVSAKKHTAYSRSRVSAAELGKYFLDPLQMDVNWGKFYPQNPLALPTTGNCLSAGYGCPGPQTINGITFTPTYCFDCCCPYPVPLSCNGGIEPHTCPNVTGTTLKRARVVISWSEY